MIGDLDTLGPGELQRLVMAQITEECRPWADEIDREFLRLCGVEVGKSLVSPLAQVGQSGKQDTFCPYPLFKPAEPVLTDADKALNRAVGVMLDNLGGK